MTVQHGGCIDCKEQTQAILVTIWDAKTAMSVAVCDTCHAKRLATAQVRGDRQR